MVNWKTDFSMPALKPLYLDETKLNGLQILHRLIHIIRQLNPDVVHTHRSKENILGGIAAVLAGGIPSIRTAHGAPEHQPNWWQFPKRTIRFLDWLTGRYLQKKIIAVSDDLANILREDFPLEKITVIENGVDLDICHSHNMKQRRDAGIVTDNFRIGLAGRLTPVKRIDLFIQTAQYLQEHHPDLNASFHIFGDGPMRNELENLSTSLKTGETVTFEGHREDIHQALHELDILMITSDHEGLPMILLEAMALQVPVIAHSVGGIPRALDYGSCGLLVQNHTPAGYGNAIYQLAASLPMRNELVKNALNHVNQHYSADKNARSYVLAYTEI